MKKIVYNENRFEKFCQYAISLVVLAFLVFLSLNSLLHTTGMKVVRPGEGIENGVYSIKENIECVIYYDDSLYLNIAYFIVSVALCFIIIPRSKKIPVRSMALFITIWTILIGTVWVYSSQVLPSGDSGMVLDASVFASKNDFSFLNYDYFHYYPYQLGYVFFNEILIRMHNIFTLYETAFFIEVLNVIFLAFSYCALILLNKELFNDNRICAITTLIFALSAAPIIFSVFIYGIIPGLTFAAWAFYFEVKYLKTDKFVFAIISAVFIAAAMVIKPNYLIFLIAMIMLVIIKFISRKRFIKDIAFVLVAIILANAASPIVIHLYEKRASIELGDSIPYASWISMGLNESVIAPGWYNPTYTVFNFSDNDRNAEKTAKVSKENIKERGIFFMKHPQYTHNFFYLKTVSQWNETSYQSIWNNQVRVQYKDKGTIARIICNGKGEKLAKKWMDIIAQFVFISSSIGLLFCIKNKNVLTLILPITVFGGFLYHTISEGKSQYIMPYYILLLGFAAYGICMLYDKMSGQFKKRPVLERMFTVTDKSEKVTVAGDTAAGKLNKIKSEEKIK